MYSFEFSFSRVFLEYILRLLTTFSWLIIWFSLFLSLSFSPIHSRTNRIVRPEMSQDFQRTRRTIIINILPFVMYVSFHFIARYGNNAFCGAKEEIIPKILINVWWTKNFIFAICYIVAHKHTHTL